MPTNREIADFVAEAGCVMLSNGAEVNRVQQTMEIMAKSCGETGVEVYVLTNALFISVAGAGAEVRHVPQASVHLNRVEAVNELSRELNTGRLSFTQAQKRLRDIKTLPYVSPLAQVLACGIGAAMFSFLYSLDVQDAAATLLVGFALGAFQLLFRRHNVSKFIYNLLCACLVASLSYVVLRLGLGDSLNAIIIGAIFPLVPGIALTTSIRDFANSDYLSGTIRLVDALLIAASIALGVGSVLKIISLYTGVAFV